MEDIKAAKGEIKFQELKQDCSFNKNFQGRPFMCMLSLCLEIYIQPCIFIGRMVAEATVLWPSDAKSQLTGKDPDVGKD